MNDKLTALVDVTFHSYVSFMLINEFFHKSKTNPATFIISRKVTCADKTSQNMFLIYGFDPNALIPYNEFDCWNFIDFTMIDN